MRDKAPETYDEKLGRLEELRYEAIHAGSDQAVAKQHERGKYTARERVEKLLDPGSFQELDTFVRHRTYDFDMQKNRPWGDAVVTGHGTIDGRLATAERLICENAADSRRRSMRLRSRSGWRRNNSREPRPDLPLRASERSNEACHSSAQARSRAVSTNCLLLREPAELADGLATCATPHGCGDSPRRP